MTSERDPNKSTQNQPWIDAFSDTKAGIQTFSSCLTLADLNSDGDYKLILADFGNGSSTTMKVYRGTSLAMELQLLSQPCVVTTIYTDRAKVRIPGVAVICGCNVLIYRNCRPYFKFSLPGVEWNGLESDCWQNRKSMERLMSLLESLSQQFGFSNLSTQSQILLKLEPAGREKFLAKINKIPSHKQVVITCATPIKKNNEDEKDVTCLIMGCETCHVHVMDPETFTIVAKFTLAGVPHIIAASGVFTVDYIIAVCCRNGAIYSIKNGELRSVTQLSTLPISMFLSSDGIITANMDSTLQSHSFRGRRQWQIELEGYPVCAVQMSLTRLALNLTAVAFENGLVHIYDGPILISSFSSSDNISSMIFGRYGQEEHALITFSSSGTIAVKLLKRTANFANFKRQLAPVANARDIKLLVPKKSKLIVEQSLRERQYSKEMYSWFQLSLYGLNVSSTESYIDAMKTISLSHANHVKLSAQVIGLGPKMKIIVVSENIASHEKTLTGLAITFLYDPKLYKLQQSYIPIGALTYGLRWSSEVTVTNLLPVNGDIQVLLVSTDILLSAVITMPPSILV